MRRVLRLGLLVVVGYALACGPRDSTTRLTFSGSALGPEGDVVRRQLARFAERRPGVRVELQVTPDSADQRHQLYVQWLNARAPTPDVLQLDVIWMSEFAAAGWILPLEAFEPGVDDFLPAAVSAARWRGSLYAIPWFVDVVALLADGSLDRRHAPRRAAEMALRLREADTTRFGMVWPGARYEGLVTVFLEHLAAFGGGILDPGGRVIVDDPAAIRALEFTANAVNVDRIVPSAALTWQEEQVRFAFQNGDAAFMRNWPYAWTLLQDETRSRVARRVAVAPFPAGDGGRPAAAAAASWPSTPGRPSRTRL
jgi:multiple sugar transport system substrate-binding protein